MSCSSQQDESGSGSGEARRANPAGAIQPNSVRVWEDEFHRLHVSVDGEEFDDVRPVRAFPVSGKADYISFLSKDVQEVALVTHPHKLDKQSRRALRKALDRMYYVAKIARVDRITEKMGMTNWEVMTDHGYAVFEVVDREHIRRLAGGRFIIIDADGNRFEIENVAELDLRSQSLVYRET